MVCYWDFLKRGYLWFMLFKGRDSYNIQVISFSNSYRVVVDPVVVLTDERTQKARCVSSGCPATESQS